MQAVTMISRRRWPWVALFWSVAIAAWLTAAACLSMPGPRRAEPSFPHDVHVVDNDLACTFCHGGVRFGDRPGMPPPELCATCHDKIDADKPENRRVGAFFGPDSRYRTVADARLPGDVMFSHGRHVTAAGLACETCHGDVSAQDQVPLGPLVQKTDCMTCHAEYGMQNTCAECHRTIDEMWRPPSHDIDWLRGHGARANCEGNHSSGRCTLCHEQGAGCTNCHATMAPRDHDHTFRIRTHGLMAAFDRSRCMTCHQQDSCQQCHQQTRPRSHRGAFGAPQSKHCVSCHLPATDAGCAVCHTGTPSHDLATALPPGHLPSMNCRLCHGNGQPLPHPDGGHVCTSCHK